MVLFEKITFIYFVYSCAGVCMYICVYMMYVCMMYVYMYVCLCGGQRATFGSWSSPSTKWILDIQFTLPTRLRGRHLYLLSHLAPIHYS